jgi:hypothetical protein
LGTGALPAACFAATFLAGEADFAWDGTVAFFAAGAFLATTFLAAALRVGFP